MNKDSHSPYHVALPSSDLNPQSPFLTVPKQPLIQHYSMSQHEASSRDHMFYIDYNVCSRKLCFGLPANCLRKRNCLMMITAAYVPYTDGSVEFEIIADHKSAFNNKRLATFGLSSSISTTAAYYSMGLSHDKLMGEWTHDQCPC